MRAICSRVPAVKKLHHRPHHDLDQFAHAQQFASCAGQRQSRTADNGAVECAGATGKQAAVAFPAAGSVGSSDLASRSISAGEGEAEDDQASVEGDMQIDQRHAVIGAEQVYRQGSQSRRANECDDRADATEESDCRPGYAAPRRHAARSQTAISPPPRLAPSTSGTPTSSGSRPWLAKAATIRIAATLEWISQVKAAPISEGGEDSRRADRRSQGAATRSARSGAVASPIMLQRQTGRRRCRAGCGRFLA